MAELRVVIAEDSVLLREGIVRLLEEQDCTVVAAVGDGDALLKAVEAHRPDVCVVDVRPRPSLTIESIAYFVVTEALANVAKHAEAAQAEVRVTRVGDVLRVEVRDDGQGGADPAGGSGLRGLTDRVAGVDGRLTVDSPPGGGTTLIAEVPCG